MFNEIKLNKEETEKLNRLKGIIEGCKSAIIAFSGGVDSTLLAYISHHILAQKSLTITVNSDFFPEQELIESKNLAKEFGFNHQVININVFDIFCIHTFKRF